MSQVNLVTIQNQEILIEEKLNYIDIIILQYAYTGYKVSIRYTIPVKYKQNVNNITMNNFLE